MPSLFWQLSQIKARSSRFQSFVGVRQTDEVEKGMFLAKAFLVPWAEVPFEFPKAGKANAAVSAPPEQFEWPSSWISKVTVSSQGTCMTLRRLFFLHNNSQAVRHHPAPCAPQSNRAVHHHIRLALVAKVMGSSTHKSLPCSLSPYH